MRSRVSGWFWQRLGRDVDDEGVVRPADDDPVVIFAGVPDLARPVRDKLEAAGFTVAANARVSDPRPLAADMGVSPRPSEVTLEIRAADFDRASRLLET